MRTCPAIAAKRPEIFNNKIKVTIKGTFTLEKRVQG